MTRNNSRATRLACTAALAILISAFTACSGSLFKVKPAADLPPFPATATNRDTGGVALRVAPLLTDEESQDLFEANLPLSGVLPLRLELNYSTGGVPLDLKRLRFRLHDDAAAGSGREWKMLSPKQAIAQILKANDVYLYNPNSRKQFEKEFGAYAIDLKIPLTTSERHRQGFLFFRPPGNGPVRSPAGLMLSVTGLPQPLEIRLN